VHNPQVQEAHDSYAKVRLPDRNFKAQRWSNEVKGFVDVPSDFIEQARFTQRFVKFSDFEMIIPGTYSPNELSILKIIRISDEEKEKIKD